MSNRLTLPDLAGLCQIGQRSLQVSGFGIQAPERLIGFVTLRIAVCEHTQSRLGCIQLAVIISIKRLMQGRRIRARHGCCLCVQ